MATTKQPSSPDDAARTPRGRPHSVPLLGKKPGETKSAGYVGDGGSKEEHPREYAPFTPGDAARFLSLPALATGSTSANLPLRTAAARDAQRSFGNRAVQRAVTSSRADGASDYGTTARRARTVRAQRAADAPREAYEVPRDVTLRSGDHGLSIPEEKREFFEKKLKRDLRDVRLHTDPDAARAADAIDAEAFTRERDVYFAAGMYEPNTAKGLRRLAHELVHTLQQAEGPQIQADARETLTVGALDDPLEREADRVADAALAGASAPPIGEAVDGEVQRAPTPAAARAGVAAFTASTMTQRATGAGSQPTFDASALGAPSAWAPPAFTPGAYNFAPSSATYQATQAPPAATTQGDATAPQLPGPTPAPAGAVDAGKQPGDNAERVPELPDGVKPAVDTPGSGGPQPVEGATPDVAQPGADGAPRARRDAPEQAGEGVPKIGKAGAGGSDGAVARGGDLDAWKGKAGAAAHALPGSTLGAPARYAAPIIKASSGAIADRQAATGRVPAEAKRAVPPPPKKLKDVPIIPEKEDQVPEATQLVKDKSFRLLPKQKLPDLVKTPLGKIPVLGGIPKPVVSADPSKLGTQVGPAKGKPPAKDPNVAKAKTAGDKLAKPLTPEEEKKQLAGKELEAKDYVVEQRKPAEPIAASVFGQIIARLLANPRAQGTRIVEDARRQLYLGVLEKDTFGNGQIDAITADVEAELRRIAAAAGIAKEALDGEIKRRQEQVAKGEKDVQKTIKDTIKDETKKLSEAHAEHDGAIKAAKKHIDASVDEKKVAASASADPQAVHAERDRLIARIDEFIAKQMVVYEDAKDQRKAELAKGTFEILKAYASAPGQDKQAYLEKNPTAPDRDAKAEETFKATEVWAAKQAVEVKKQAGKLQAEVETSIKTYQGELQAAGAQAREKIRDWAAAKLGQQRSWWAKLFEQLSDWGNAVKAQSKAWEERRARESAAAISQDVSFLAQLQTTQMKTAADATSEDVARMSEEQKAVFLAYYQDGQDSIGAVAAGLITRISVQKRPDVQKAIEDDVLQTCDDTEKLAAVGRAQRPGFNPWKPAYMCRDAFERWGTDEDKVYAALAGLTAVQGKAVKRAYWDAFHEDFDKRLDSEMGGAEYDRAKALVEGKASEADAAALRDAVQGIGTDEDLIFKTLRGKSPQEVAAIKAAYYEKYHESLDDRLDDELSGHDLDRANALMSSNTALADAIQLDDAMNGGWFFGAGTDEGTIYSVYDTINAEVKAKAAQEGWDNEQIDAEIKKRKAEVEKAYNKKYGEADEQEAGTERSKLRKEFKDELSGPELHLAFALADDQEIKAGAARLQVEHEGIIYADDDKINGVLQDQYQRAFDRRNRDALPVFLARRELAALRGEPWDKEKFDKEKEAYQAEVVAQARRDGKANMTALRTEFNNSYRARNFGLDFDKIIDMDTQGQANNKAALLIAEGGYLTPAQEVEFAVRGVGTDEDTLKKVLVGKSKAEIDKIRKDWNAQHPGEDFDDFILSDLSGDDEFEIGEALQYGKPETPAQERAALERRAAYEKQGLAESFAGEESRLVEKDLESLRKAEGELGGIKSSRIKLPDGTTVPFNPDKPPPKYSPEWEARKRDYDRLTDKFDMYKDRAEGAIDLFKSQAERVTDIAAHIAGAVAMVAAIVVGALITVASGGTLGPAAIAGIAALGSLIGTAFSMGTKWAMKGSRYGWEEVLTDAAVGVVEAAAAAATAGVGDKLLKPGKMLGNFAAKGAVSKFLASQLARGAENALQSLPGAFVGNVLNDANLKGGNKIWNVIAGTAGQVGQNLAIAPLMHVAAKPVSALADRFAHAIIKKPPITPEPTDLLALRGKPEERLKNFKEYKKKFPEATYGEFSEKLDQQILLEQKAKTSQRRLEGALRGELLQHIPPAERGQFAKVPIDMVSPEEFAAFSRSKRANAVVIIEDGKPRVIVKRGAPPEAFAEEAEHLLQTLDPEVNKKIARLDEKVMRKWDELPLEKKISLYKDKIDVEIHAQRRILSKLEARAAPPEEFARARQSLAALEKQKARVEELELFHDFGQAEAVRAQHDYLEKPARLFNLPAEEKLKGKAEFTRESGKIADHEPPDPFEPGYDKRPRELVKRGSSTYDRKELPAGAKVYEIDRWKEIDPSLKPGEHDYQREYRRVDVRDAEGKLIDTREEIRMKDKAGGDLDRWRQRGSESTERGDVMETRASQRWIEQRVAASEGRLKAVNPKEGATGFDNAMIEFERLPDGTPKKATIVQVEVKDYQGYVPFEEFTAVTANLEKSIAKLEKAITESRGLTKAEKEVALAAVEERRFRLEVHLGPDAELGSFTRGTVVDGIKETQRLWRNIDALDKAGTLTAQQQKELVALRSDLEARFKGDKTKYPAITDAIDAIGVQVRGLALDAGVKLGPWNLPVAVRDIPQRFIQKARLEVELVGKASSALRAVGLTGVETKLGALRVDTKWDTPFVFADADKNPVIFTQPRTPSNSLAVERSSSTIVEQLRFNPPGELAPKPALVVLDTRGMDPARIGPLLEGVVQKAGGDATVLKRLKLIVDPAKLSDVELSNMFRTVRGKTTGLDDVLEPSAMVFRPAPK